jgi:hypothetical protein
MAKSSRSLGDKAILKRSVNIPQKRVMRVGRNDRCPCESGKKYKDCHADEGEAFLLKLQRESERKELLEKQKREGVPWLKRLLTRALH